MLPQRAARGLVLHGAPEGGQRQEPQEPTRGPREVHPLPEDEVAALLRAWTDSATNPRTAAVGLLCLVYGLSASRIATLPLSAVDLTTGTFRGLAVPAPLPDWLRPVLEWYLRWRQELLGGVSCDKFVVTQRSHNHPANSSLFHRMLRPYRVTVRQLRDTALAQTIQHGHLNLLTVFGLSHHSLSRYEAFARLVRNTRKVAPKPNLW